MAKRLTLAEQLAQINEPAPQDFDPEDSYATYNHERRKGGDEDEDAGAADGNNEAAAAARADYVDVGESKLRKRGEAVLDSKYQGKKGSRADLYAFSDNEDEDEEDEAGMDKELAELLNGAEEDEDEEDEEGEGYESEGGDFEDLEGEEDVSAFKPGGAGDFADDDDDEEDEEEEDEEEDAPKKKAVPAAKESKVRVSKDDRAMVKQLKQAASADVEKGRDVKKQLAFSDSLLSSRIALQKAVQASNALPTHASQPPASAWFEADEEVKEELEELWKEMVGCSEELFALRKDLLTTNESLPFTSDFGSSRKRKRAAAADGGDEDARSEWLEATMRDLGEVEKILDPFLRTTVTKWSDKVLAASGLSLGKSSSSKFKAVNQNAMQQIDHALSASTGERERLVKRTRVRRTTEGVGATVLGKREKAEQQGGDVLAPLEGEEGREKAVKEVDVECFDDSDWYGQVLRDLVESRMLDLDDSTLTQLRQASALARGKKVKKVVDTRASKGRKIRYHVHEKAQNFMIPVEAGHWHDEQIDELFASLLGRSFPQANGAAGKEALDPALDHVAGQKAGEIEVGSLRLFA
ncbi:hypothetical protein JCM11251_006786 [Rhodosporidiobolus azoricus]